MGKRIRKRRAGWIYVLQEAGDKAGPVKVGFANDVLKRIAQLQTGNHRPLHIVKMFHGDSKLEAALHRSFRHEKLAGEWFEYSEDVRQTLSMFEDKGSYDEPKEPTLDEEAENWLCPHYRMARKLVDEIGRPPGYKSRVRPPDRVVMAMVERGIL